MQYCVQRNKGFAIDHELAENLSMSNELLTWEEEFNELPFLEAFEKKFNFAPSEIIFFGLNWEDERQVEGLQGFEHDLIYVLFDVSVDRLYSNEWNNLISFLEECDVELIEGGWIERC